MKKVFLSLVILFTSAFAQEIYATFNVEAQKSAQLAFYASGIVDKVFVDVTSHVKKGEKLAELKNGDLLASLNIAKSALEDAKSSLKFAQRDYERQQKIKHLIDQAKFDQYEEAYERAKIAVISAQANVANKQSLFDNSILRAPFDGVITSKVIELGDVVSSMMLKTAFTMQSANERKLILEFDQKYWKEIKVGDDFKYKIDGDSKEYVGKISKIYPSANSTNRKMKAEVLASGFVVGLFGDGNIETSK